MTEFNVVFAPEIFPDLDVERAHLAGRPVELRTAPLGTPEEVARSTADAHAIVLGTAPLSAAHIGALGERVRVIGRPGVGLDSVDLAAAASRGLGVIHAPDYCVEEVVTHTLALALALHRRLLAADAVARDAWSAWDRIGEIRPLSELTVGVVGCGRMGSTVAERLALLAGSVLVHDPAVYSPPQGARSTESLAELLAVADIVTLHAALTDSSRGLIGAEELGSMKPTAVLINVARGGLVDQGALAEALRSGRLAGAALDVLASEPPESGDPILSAPNVLLSPHVGWYSAASERRVRTQTIDAVLDYLAGREPGAGRLAVDGRFGSDLTHLGSTS